MGTPGELRLPDGWGCKTLELPWRGNATGKSCIPPGVYDMHYRRSPTIERMTKGEHLSGWELQSVPGRSLILFHPGNSVVDTEGCILVGSDFSGWTVDNEFRWTVTASRLTYTEFARRLERDTHWTVSIRYFHPYGPDLA